jgi:formylglycine-generating enzyme required for sulfatase activity
MRPTARLLPALALALALDARAAPPQVFRDAFQDGTGRRGPELVYIPGGRFRMGSLPDEPGYRLTEVPHPVVLSPFALGRCEVTHEELAGFLDEEGNNDGGLPYVDLAREGAGIVVEGGRFRPAPGASRLPVTGISWRGALAYTQWLTRKTGQPYTLPTEAQWERAARAGTQTAFPWGDRFEPGRIHCGGGEDARPEPVGTHPPNPFGLYDMLGNVWEWTLDCFTLDFYFYAPLRDPRLLDEGCLAPGIRGGSFRDPPEYCGAGYRVNHWWRGHADGIGFRVARAVDVTPPRK